MKNVKTEVVIREVVSRSVIITAIGIAFACTTMMAPVSAKVVPATQTVTSYGQDFVVNYDNNTIWLDGNTSSALVGHVIQFYDANGNASGKVTLTGVSENNAGEIKFSDSYGRIDISGIKTGDYNVTGEAEGCVPTVVSVGDATMDLKLKKGTKTISSIPQGTRISVIFTSSLDPNDGVTLKVIDPSGDIYSTNPADNTVFDKVNVAHVTDREIDTAGWELGTYKFKVSTEEEYARGLRKETAEIRLEIVSPELKIEPGKTEIVVSEKVKLTVTGVPDHNISISVERGAEHATFPGGINDNPAGNKIGNLSDVKIDADGKSEYVVYFEKIGSYTVKVRDLDTIPPTEDATDISVSKKKVTLYTPETCAIGADLILNGTANTGKTVDIAIDDLIVKVDAAIDKNGKLEVKLPTPATSGTDTEGAIKIKAFIEGDFSIGDDASGINADGSIMVLMITGDLTAESSATLVSPGDSFTLSGTAPGSKAVDILIVGPKGGGGEGMNPTNSEDNNLPTGTVYEATSVGSDFTWSAEIEVNEEADTGLYLVFVLTSGRNQIYDGIKTGEVLEGIAGVYLGGDLARLASKTQEEIKAILLDATTDAPGSDDSMKLVKVYVGSAEVALYSLADVVIGDDLEITGTSNREGHTMIIRVKGPIDLGTKFVRVENGKFKATFSTVEALTGEYSVIADDGEDHTDSTTVKIITPVRTQASPTPAPTPTPANTSVPTAPQEVPEPTPTPERALMQGQPETSSTPFSSKLALPGFEAIMVIAAVLIVYLRVAGSRKKKV